MTVLLCALLLAAQLGAVTPKPAPPTPAPERVEVVLYSDFQCPYCAHFARAFRELQSKGVEGVQTTVRFKHFPLGMHPAAPLMHRAALAAGEQGKFWEMHDLLFANQAAFAPDKLTQYATELGLDAERFAKDLKSEGLGQLVEADKAEGERLGVQGTPTFFVNGRVYSGTRTYEQLRQLVEYEQRRMRALSEISDESLSRGPSDAPVTLEIFADLQSPVSRPALDIVDEAVRRYPSKIRIQFRNFPLAFHPEAKLAHEAAMTAAARGRFWDFARHILSTQDALREQDLIAHAGRLGLDQEQFAELLRQHRYTPRVEADIEAGLKRGVRGSPVVFVNTHRIDGVPSLEKLIGYVESELTASRGQAR
jgi:protein-disulfide isomerase